MRRGLRGRGGRRSYRESRLEPGDPVTIVGRALPFSDLADPAWADVGGGSDPLIDDPEIAADLAEARADGTLVDDPADGLGQRRHPRLRDRASGGRAASSTRPRTRCPLADAEAAARAERTFRIAPETLILAASDEVPLLIAHGVPGVVVGARPGPLPGRPARGDPGHRVGDGRRPQSRWRARVVSAPEAAAVFAVALLVGIGGFIVLTSYNAVVALRQRIDKAWSNIDVVLKQRHDQLPNLVAAVRDLMAFERDVLTRVTEARSAYAPAAPIHDQAVTSEATTAAVRSLFAVVERYPDIKSAANVADLQDEIERLEAMIADRRELYNDQVYRYNTRIAQVPGALLAPLFGWRPREFFAADPAELERPDVDAAGLDDRIRPGHPRRPGSPSRSSTPGSSATARPSGRVSAATPAAPTSRSPRPVASRRAPSAGGWPARTFGLVLTSPLVARRGNGRAGRLRRASWSSTPTCGNGTTARSRAA